MDEERALGAVLDAIVPPDPARGMPGAGSLGLAPRVALAMREIAALVAAGLEKLDERARAQGAPDFASLAQAERKEALEELSTTQPGFLPNVVFHTYQAYYQDPRVLEALGLEPRPPFPLGYSAPENDLSLLEAVRARGPLYREP